MTTTQVTGPTPKVKMQRRLIMAAFAAAAVAAIAFGVISGGDKPELEPGAGIVELIPPEDDETFQQAPVGVQLESTYVGTIIINGTEIPADELQNPVDPESGELINARNRLVFQPGQGKVIERLRPGRNCVVVNYFPPAEPFRQRNYAWCFEVL